VKRGIAIGRGGRDDGAIPDVQKAESVIGQATESSLAARWSNCPAADHPWEAVSEPGGIATLRANTQQADAAQSSKTPRSCSKTAPGPCNALILKGSEEVLN
jgi:hypothetical protein